MVDSRAQSMAPEATIWAAFVCAPLSNWLP